MGERKRRLTPGRLMGLIGLVALGLAMTRGDARPAVSMCVFAACTCYLAGRRYTEALARRAAEGVAPTTARKARLAARCFLIAACAIGLPDAAFLGGYYGYMQMVRSLVIRETNVRLPLELDATHMLLGALIGISAALYVAALMRRGFRSAARPSAGITPETQPTAARSVLKQEHIAAQRVSTGPSAAHDQRGMSPVGWVKPTIAST